MHLLFISSNRIGDSLINLQVLNKYIRKNKKDIEPIGIEKLSRGQLINESY